MEMVGNHQTFTLNWWALGFQAQNSICIYVYISILPKTKMNPKKDGFAKEFPFQLWRFLQFMLGRIC